MSKKKRSFTVVQRPDISETVHGWSTVEHKWRCAGNEKIGSDVAEYAARNGAKIKIAQQMKNIPEDATQQQVG